MDNKLVCDLCGATNFEFLYEPEGSMRSLKVFICKECGLVQSFPKIDHIERRNVAVSGRAACDNIRYGKGF